MSMALTSDQQQALDKAEDSPQRMVDPRTGTAYVLVPEVEYEAIRTLVEDDRRERAIHSVALRNASRRLDETP